MLKVRLTEADIVDGGERLYVARISRYGARGVLLNEHGHVALMYFSGNGMYKLPGGGMEYNETKEEAFLREIKEETGYDCRILRYLGTVEEHRLKRDCLHVSFCFLAHTVGDKSDTNLTEEEKSQGIATKWMPIEEAIDRLHTSILNDQMDTFKFILLRDKAVLEYAKRGNFYET